MAEPNIKTFLVTEAGALPNNNTLTLISIQQAFDPDVGDLARAIEKTFHKNNWGRSWRNGIFPFHHYHSTAHEVLGLYSGQVTAPFGGPDGKNGGRQGRGCYYYPCRCISHLPLEKSVSSR